MSRRQRVRDKAEAFAWVAREVIYELAAKEGGEETWEAVERVERRLADLLHSRDKDSPKGEGG